MSQIYLLFMISFCLFCLNWFCLRFTFSSWSASVCFVSDLPSLHDQLLFVLFKLVLSQIYLFFMISFCLFCLRFTFSSWSASVCFVSDLPSLHDQLLFVLFKLVLSQIYLLFMISFKFSSVHIDSVHLHIQCRISTIYCTLYSYWTIKEMSNCQMKIHLSFLDRNFVNSQMM